MEWLDRNSFDILFSMKDHIRSMSSRQLRWKESMTWTGSLIANLEVVYQRERHAVCTIMWTWLATMLVGLRLHRVVMWPMISWDFYLTLLPINDRLSRVGFDDKGSCLSYVLLCSTDRRYWWYLLLFCVFSEPPQGTSILGMLWRLSDVGCWFCTCNYQLPWVKRVTSTLIFSYVVIH